MGATTKIQQYACFRSSVKYKRLYHAIENTVNQNATFLVDGKNNGLFNNFLFRTSLCIYFATNLMHAVRCVPLRSQYNMKSNINFFKRKAFKGQ